MALGKNIINNLLFIGMASLLYCTVAGAQKPAMVTSPEKPVKEASGIARTEKEIPVPQPKSDEAIASRLSKILSLTGWFKDLKVTSEEGIVTLNGRVDVASQREWAVDLANDTDGVVAVINKVSLTEVGWFDITATKNELKNIWKKFFAFLPHLLIGIIIMAISLMLYRTGAKFNNRFWQGRIQNPVLSDVVSKLGALPILLIGLYLFLQVLGLTGLAFTLLGGTGALGLVAGFAFKNILENYFSGVMLSLRKPFKVGDRIEVAGEKGVVYKMTTRGTTLIDSDGKHILIPNTIVFTGIIRNQTASKATRIKMVFETQKESLARNQAEILNFLKARSEVVKSPESTVLPGGTQDKPTLEASFWIDPNKTDAEKMKSAIMSEIRLLDTPPLNTPAKVKDTDNDVQAILSRAAQTDTSDSKERHL